MRKLALSIAFAAPLWGCGQADLETVTQRAEPLYYAAPSGPEDNAVLKLRAIKNDNDTLWCTATLIAPNLVLTAMHCVATVTEDANCTTAGELAAGSTEGLFGAPFLASNITLHVGPGADEPVAAIGEKIFTTGAVSVCKDDAAVVALDRELTDVPVAALRLGAGNQRGEAIRIVGFGGAEDGTTGVRKTRDDLKIQLLGQSAYSDSNDPIPPDTFATIGVSVCNGDSGGPVFTTKNAVTGIVSHGASCASTTARRIFTQVAPYEDVLLKPAFAYVGHSPILEASDASAAGGEGGEGGEGSAAGAPNATGQAGAGTGPAALGAAGDATDAHADPLGKGGCTCSSAAGGRSGLPAVPLTCALALSAAFALRRKAKPQAC